MRSEFLDEYIWQEISLSNLKSIFKDFYDYLLTGKTPRDEKLQLDDVIFIPNRGKTITIRGEINQPGIYELKDKKLNHLMNQFLSLWYIGFNIGLIVQDKNLSVISMKEFNFGNKLKIYFGLTSKSASLSEIR